MATSIEKILRGCAFNVTKKCHMEFDDAYQELAIVELGARRRYRPDYKTESGAFASYETYLQSVLRGATMKLVSKSLSKATYSLDEMLQPKEEGGSLSAEAYISYDEHRYKGVNWKVFIEQVAYDQVDVFIMEMLLDGWNQAEIAKLLEFTQSAVRQRLDRYKEEFGVLLAA